MLPRKQRARAAPAQEASVVPSGPSAADSDPPCEPRKVGWRRGAVAAPHGNPQAAAPGGGMQPFPCLCVTLRCAPPAVPPGAKRTRRPSRKAEEALELGARARDARPQAQPAPSAVAPSASASAVTPPSDATPSSETQECGVCFDVVKLQGKLDSCDHMFCFQCIEAWSKIENTCPHCKVACASVPVRSPLCVYPVFFVVVPDAHLPALSPLRRSEALPVAEEDGGVC